MKGYYLFCSIIYFVRQVFRRKHYHIIFYAPHHFNRGDSSENIFFRDLLNVCETDGLSFLYLEEPDIYSSLKRSNTAIPFDFIYFLIIFLRKFMWSEMSHIEIDKKIGSFIKNIFFRKITFDNYITISQSMLSLFNGINSSARCFDLQHGTIHGDKKSYLHNGMVSKNLQHNDAHLLLSGSAYKDILIKNENNEYFKNHINVIGSSIFDYSNIIIRKPNNNVLVSLQFTHDHSNDENIKISDRLLQLIREESSFHFYLKNHPRFNNEVDLNRFLILPNVSLISKDLKDCFSMCSFHLTAYSTVTFEAALHGVPSFFLNSDSLRKNIFKTQYNYPLYKYSLSYLYDNYRDFPILLQTWAAQFYQPFCKEAFLKSLYNG